MYVYIFIYILVTKLLSLSYRHAYSLKFRYIYIYLCVYTKCVNLTEKFITQHASYQVLTIYSAKDKNNKNCLNHSGY